tara:strand:- start:656 stop:2176 length:1521 start_codon:yes stop_codon:yes gene_type:complete
MAEKKVKTYTYNGDKYQLYYDTSNGSHSLKKFGITSHTTVFEDGGFNTDGTDDTNLTTNGITLETVQEDIKNGIADAYVKSGGTANKSILPGWLRNKFPDFFAELDQSIKNKGLDSGVSINLDDYGKNDKFFGGVGKSAQYPIDALYSTTLSDRGTKSGVVKGGDERQDHLSISQYKYKVPRAEALFGEGANKVKSLTEGIRRNTPLEKFLGIVKLPMPNDISDSNNVAWGEDKMNALEAAGIAEFGNMGAGDMTAVGTGALLEGFAGIKGATAGSIWAKIVGGNLQGIGKAKEMYGAELTSRTLSMAGIDAPAEAILARGKGVIPNSNLELLFQGPMLREFQFVYKMSPRSDTEATVVNQIVRFFKQGMAAKKVSQSGGGVAGGSSFFLGTPNVFRLQYRTTNNDAPPGVNRIKTCALTGTSVNYTPEGTWASYEGGQPVSIMMTLRFQELEPIYDTDYAEYNPFSTQGQGPLTYDNFKTRDSLRDNDTTSLGHKLSIKSDEVGY